MRKDSKEVRRLKEIIVLASKALSNLEPNMPTLVLVYLERAVESVGDKRSAREIWSGVLAGDK